MNRRDQSNKTTSSCYTDKELSIDALIKTEMKKKDTRLHFHQLCDMSSLLPVMKCTLCNYTPVPPAWHCSSGHLICRTCSLGLNNNSCAFQLINKKGKAEDCGAAVVLYPIEIYKKMYESSLMSCCYENDGKGCQEKFIGSLFQYHLTKCQYRPSIRCPVSECKKVRVEPIYFQEHLVADHAVLTATGNAFELQVLHQRQDKYPILVGEYRWIVALFTYKNLDFLLMVQEGQTELHMWISLVSSAAAVKGKLFIGRLSVKAPGTNRKLQWTGDVCPMEREMNEIAKSDDCFTIQKKPFEKDFIYQIEEHLYFNMEVLVDEYLVETYQDDGKAAAAAAGTGDLESGVGQM